MSTGSHAAPQPPLPCAQLYSSLASPLVRAVISGVRGMDLLRVICLRQASLRRMRILQVLGMKEDDPGAILKMPDRAASVGRFLTPTDCVCVCVCVCVPVCACVCLCVPVCACVCLCAVQL